jgi:hypothetical protein
MHLQEEMAFDAVKVKSIAITSAEDPGVVVEVYTVLPTKHAKLLRVDFLMNGSVVREQITGLAVNVNLEDIEVLLPSGIREDHDSYFAETIEKIQVKRTEQGQLGASFRFHLPLADADSIIDFFRKYNKVQFAMSLRSRQGELFQGGTRVSVSEGEGAKAEEVDRSHENRPKGGRRKKADSTTTEEPAAVAEEEPLLQ